MFRTSIHLLLFCGAMAVTLAHDLTGVVYDADTQLPLAGANVILLPSGKGTATSDHGTFSFSDLLPGTVSVRVRFMGYQETEVKSVRILTDATVSLTIRLHPLVVQAPELSVSAERLWHADSADIVIDRSAITRSLARDVGELLRQNGAVQMSYGDGKSRTSIRGSQSNQVLVLIDGVPLKDQMDGSVDLSSLPLSMVERIEITKGAAGMEFGNGAAAGTINIITRNVHQSQTELTVRKGEYGLAGGELGLYQSWQKMHAMVVLQSERQQGNYPFHYEHAGRTVSNVRKNAGSSQHSALLKTAAALAGHHLGLSVFYLSDEQELPGQLFALTPFARSEQQRWHFRLNDRFDIGEFAQLLSWVQKSDELKSFKNRYDRQNVPLAYRTVPPYWNENRLYQWDGGSRLDWQIKKWRLSTGIGFQTSDFTEKDNMSLFGSAVGQARYHSQRVYSRIQGPLPLQGLGFAWQGAAGYAYDRAHLDSPGHDSRLFEHHTPTLRITGSKRLALLWQISGSWSGGFRLPTFADLFYHQIRIMGNPMLLPEQTDTRQVSLYASWQKSGQGRFKTVLFEHDMQNTILWQMGSFASFSPSNVNAKVQGVELEFEQKIGALKFWMCYQKEITSNLSDRPAHYDKELPYRPEYKGFYSVQYEKDWYYGRWNSRFIGSRYVTPSNTASLPSYHAHDMTIGIKRLYKKFEFEFQISVFNLFDHQFQVIERYPLAGREWRMALKIYWLP